MTLKNEIPDYVILPYTSFSKKGGHPSRWAGYRELMIVKESPKQ